MKANKFLFIVIIFFFLSFWGKFAQRTNMTQVEMIKDPERYFDLLSSDAVEVQNARFVNDEMIELHYMFMLLTSSHQMQKLTQCWLPSLLPMLD